MGGAARRPCFPRAEVRFTIGEVFALPPTRREAEVTHYALSLKQPWAALLVHGRKTVEVRRWATARRGRVLIHAARVPDERDEAWAQVPAELLPAAGLRGGVVGSADLRECLTYRSPEHFAADRPRHLNPPAWFRPPALHGFVFADPQVLAFRPHPGQVKFFRIADGPPSPPRRAGLLVSVRTAEEAAAALAGGAAIIDVKEPGRGPLGRADDRAVADVVRLVAGRRPVSAACGELRGAVPPPPGLAFLKWGLAGCGAADWKALFGAAERESLRASPVGTAVAVAYADWRAAGAPPVDDVVAFALARPGGVLLLDTFQKAASAGAPSAAAPTLLDFLPIQKLALYCTLCRERGVRVALAGSLGAGEIARLAPLGPDWLAVRGAACAGGRRDAPVEEAKVRQLARLLTDAVTGATRAS
jgi:uncharacterized protein (UPF0264 family)